MPGKKFKGVKSSCNRRMKQGQGVEETLKDMSRLAFSTDPLGSWTGVPTDPEEEPVQDADDL